VLLPDNSARRPADPVHVTLPRKAWVAAIVLGAAFVFFVALSSYVFIDQLRTVRDQRRMQAGLSRSSLPVLREGRRQIPASRDALTRGRELLRTAQPLAERLLPLTRDLSDADLPAALREAVRIVPPVVDLTAELRRRDLLQRTSRTLAATQTALERIDRLGLLQDADRAATLTTRSFPQLLAMQRRTLRSQLQALQLQRQALAVARETLAHAASMDEKLGGQLPATARPTSAAAGR
jgi:hypothetical protein